MVDPHFTDTLTHGLYIPRIAGSQPVDADKNFSPRCLVTQAANPCREFVCPPDLKHGAM